MYFVIQITRDKSGLAKALYDYPDIISARSAYHSFLASALINADVVYALAEIIDESGNVYEAEVKEGE